MQRLLALTALACGASPPPAAPIANVAPGAPTRAGVTFVLPALPRVEPQATIEVTIYARGEPDGEVIKLPPGQHARAFASARVRVGDFYQLHVRATATSWCNTVEGDFLGEAARPVVVLARRSAPQPADGTLALPHVDLSVTERGC